MAGPFDTLFDLDAVNRAVVCNYAWAIHVSPEVHLVSIREKGLIANRDAPIPSELVGLVPKAHILCLHPLGAKLCPPPVCNTLENTRDIKMVTFAVETTKIPRPMHIDWSYSWDLQSGRVDAGLSGEENAFKLIREFGSFVTYASIAPENLRIFCDGCEPTNPKSWPHLLHAKNIARFRKSS